MRFIALLLAASAAVTNAQVTTYSILKIDLQNSTLYVADYCGPADRGKNPNKLPAPPSAHGTGIADIVSVNGQPVKGTAMEAINSLFLTSTTFSPGNAIVDFLGAPPITSWDLGFLNLDGSVIGTVHVAGSGGGPPPPGAPKEITAASWTVTGGTGAFFGARGYFLAPQDAVSPERRTTDCEDPAYRRINADSGGNKRHPVLYLVSPTQPQITVTAGAPAVFHLDFTPVSAAKPAQAGEVLIAMATGLGPTRPGVNPGEPFPADPLQAVNSPVGVTVNQQSTDVINAVGWPGLVDTYRIDFRVPAGTASGQASVQLSSAWIVGPPVNIPVQ